MKKHILILCMHFYPTQFRVNDIAYDLVKRGYKVTAVTAIPNYPQGSFTKGYGWLRKRRETYQGIDIIRIPIFPRGNSSITMILNYLSFQFFGFFFSVFTKIKADHVFIYGTSPLLKSSVALRYAKRKKIPSTFYVMDLWPDSVIYAGGIHNKHIISYLTKFMKKQYDLSRDILTSSKSFIPEITKLGISEEKVKYWPQYAEDVFKSSKVYDMPKDMIRDEHLNLVFAGTIGVAQGLDILVETAVLLKKDNLFVRFVLIGDGRAKEDLIHQMTEKNVLSYFHLIDKKPVDLIPNYFRYSDAALITLLDTPIFEKTIPAKLQSYMLYGIPILASATGEVAGIIHEASCGYASYPEDAVMFKNIIIKFMQTTHDERKIMALNAQKYANTYFDKETLMNELIDLIEGKEKAHV